MTATQQGAFPTGTVAVTVLVVVSITEVVLLSKFATYTFVPSGVTATPKGLPSIGTVAVTVSFAVSITEVVLLL